MDLSFKNIKKKLLRFWRTDNEKISLIRDVTVALIAVLIILMGLWAYTGQWLGAPMVAIESGSMMHQDEPFGRLGTIDAGDMVLLVKVDSRDDIVTRGGDYGGAYATKDPDKFFYGEYGDVIVYKKNKLCNPSQSTEDEQIIHRAMCWVEYNEEYNRYTVEEYGIINRTSITISELGLQSYKPPHSGYITKGDNPVTNKQCDQAGGICTVPIKMEWITGKARSELPWIGTINLFFNDIMSGSFFDGREITVYNVPQDSIICLVILIVVLISIPIILDVYDYYKSKKKKKNNNLF
jgi:signal peptidase